MKLLIVMRHHFELWAARVACRASARVFPICAKSVQLPGRGIDGQLADTEVLLAWSRWHDLSR